MTWFMIRSSTITPSVWLHALQIDLSKYLILQATDFVTQQLSLATKAQSGKLLGRIQNLAPCLLHALMTAGSKNSCIDPSILKLSSHSINCFPLVSIQRDDPSRDYSEHVERSPRTQIPWIISKQYFMGSSWLRSHSSLRILWRSYFSLRVHGRQLVNQQIT